MHTDRFDLSKLALILDPMVQQRGNRLIPARSVLERESGDGKEVRDTGNARAFADLVAVQAAGVDRGVADAVGEEGRAGVPVIANPPVAGPNANSARQQGCGRHVH